MRTFSPTNASWIIVTLTLLLMFGCGSSSNDPNPQYSINLNGGHTNLTIAGAQGGKGGEVKITSDGTLTMSPTGSVSFDITIPNDTPNTSNTHYPVLSDETVQLNIDSGLTGNLYVLDSDLHLYRGNGDGTANNSVAIEGGSGNGDEIIDSLFISEGITLKLPDNFAGEFSIELSEDILIDGAVVSESGLSAITLDTKTNLIIGSSGVISTKPTLSNEDGRKITLYAGLNLINEGVINGSGSEGGDGFDVDLNAYENLYNTGIIRNDGGDNLAGSAGKGGDILLYSFNGSLYSSGIINANGGNATNGIGGQNGSIHLETLGSDTEVDPPLDTQQQIQINGLVEANGGDAVDTDGGDAVVAAGGNALGRIKIINVAAPGSQILVNTTLNSKSGNAAGIDTSGGSGELSTTNYGGVVVSCPEGSVHMTGTIDVTGGSGDKTGGNSGRFLLPFDTDYPNATENIELIYDGIIMNGGDGDTGGDGGHLVANSAATTNDFAIRFDGGLGATIDGSDGSATIDGAPYIP